jgi:hypothetical protein
MPRRPKAPAPPTTPCERNSQLKALINDYAEVLKTQAHTLGQHQLAEHDFYDSGVFRGAVERIRGQFSAGMAEKRNFARDVLNHMQDSGTITNWESTGQKNRHDYSVTLPTGKVAVIELKGCLDGNNTNIYERPSHAQEFVIWSICTNLSADPRKNAWSGIHTRLSADLIERQQRVDGLIIWDMVCGTVARPCPKLIANAARTTAVTSHRLPPPCIYVFPATIASVRNNPRPTAQAIEGVELLQAFQTCFGGLEHEINYVDFEVAHEGAETVRTTRIRRAGEVIWESAPTPIQRA